MSSGPAKSPTEMNFRKVVSVDVTEIKESTEMFILHFPESIFLRFSIIEIFFFKSNDFF
jgi:hypothetical protein